jgi:hypothetical protein
MSDLNHDSFPEAITAYDLGDMRQVRIMHECDIEDKNKEIEALKETISDLTRELSFANETIGVFWKESKSNLDFCMLISRDIHHLSRNLSIGFCLISGIVLTGIAGVFFLP